MFVMMLTFLNLLVVRGVLVGIPDSSMTNARTDDTGDVFISRLDGDLEIDKGKQEFDAKGVGQTMHEGFCGRVYGIIRRRHFTDDWAHRDDCRFRWARRPVGRKVFKEWHKFIKGQHRTGDIGAHHALHIGKAKIPDWF